MSGALQTPVGQVVVRVVGGSVVRCEWAARLPPADSDAPRSTGTTTGTTATARADSSALLDDALAQLREYFAGSRRALDLPLDLSRLEPPTRQVLTTLAETVGYGETVTYGELATRSGTGMPARAIGSVMGANPVPLIIPCHRVLAADGLGGFSGGAPGHGRETKIWLLEHEGALPPALW